MKLRSTVLLFAIITLAACKKNETPSIPVVNEDAASFTEIATINIAGTGAAEISAYDPATKKLFVVNNDEKTLLNQIDIIDLTNPAQPVKSGIINVANYGAVNSLDVFDGKLAAAIEDKVKQNNGRVVVYNTTDHKEIKVITVGALPDMVTFSKDGNYILTANEGEPSQDYTNDPAGTISIIDVKNNYAVTTIDFSAFKSQEAALKAKGFRVFGVGKDFVKDIEPEYITVSKDSKTAWVTLQENNAIAKIDIRSKRITDIFPLGFKNYNTAETAIDISDKDGKIEFAAWPVKGVYMPDGIAVYETGGVPHLFTANEGDAREYTAFTEAERIAKITLDGTAFPNAADLKKDAMMGRLNITKTMGDNDGDGDYDELYSFGARSFSVWNGNTGAQIFDSKNELDIKAKEATVYDDARSDDKSVEPEGITIGQVGNKMIAFVGMERADAVAIYDITDPVKPAFLQMIKCGDAPEGVLFIPAAISPTKRSLLVVSSEGDGNVKIYQPAKL